MTPKAEARGWILGQLAVVGLVAWAFLGFPWFPNQSTPKPDTTQSKAADDEAALIKDLLRVGPEMERRLANYITVRDGLLIVRDPVMAKLEMHVLPVTTPWVIHCGFGLSIAFGSSVSGDSSGITNDVEIRLAFGMVPAETCSTIAPQVARRLVSMLRE